MPILQNQTIGEFTGTIVELGHGDVHVNVCVDPETNQPSNAMMMSPDLTKPVDEWRLGDPFEYKGPNSTPTSGVFFTFGRVESVNAVIEVLEEVRRTMLAKSASDIIVE